MTRFLAALATALVLTACTPPPADPPAVEPETPAPAVDLGPYSNTWDSAEFSTFRHDLYAPEPGMRRLSLMATTDAPGGETVAIYPVGPDGVRRTQRIMFVIADTDGGAEDAEVEFPADGSPVVVEVIVENAGGRRHAGNYTLGVAR